MFELICLLLGTASAYAGFAVLTGAAAFWCKVAAGGLLVLAVVRYFIRLSAEYSGVPDLAEAFARFIADLFK